MKNSLRNYIRKQVSVSLIGATFASCGANIPSSEPIMNEKEVMETPTCIPIKTECANSDPSKCLHKVDGCSEKTLEIGSISPIPLNNYFLQIGGTFIGVTRGNCSDTGGLEARLVTDINIPTNVLYHSYIPLGTSRVYPEVNSILRVDYVADDGAILKPNALASKAVLIECPLPFCNPLPYSCETNMFTLGKGFFPRLSAEIRGYTFTLNNINPSNASYLGDIDFSVSSIQNNIKMSGNETRVFYNTPLVVRVVCIGEESSNFVGAAIQTRICSENLTRVE